MHIQPRHHLWSAACLGLFCLTPALASAQSTGSVTLQNYEPAPGSDAIFSVDGSDVAESNDFSGGLVLHYAENPINNDTGRSRLNSRLTGDLLFSMGLVDRFELGVGLPLYLQNQGTNASNQGFDEADVGDLRLRPKVSILDPNGSPVGLAAYTQLGLPTGELRALSGTEQFYVQPGLIADVRSGRMRVSLNTGARIQETSDVGEFEAGSVLTYGLGAQIAVVPDVLALSGEIFGSTDITNPFDDNINTPIEALGGVQFQEQNSGLRFSLAGGSGVIDGFSTPDYRVMAGVQYVHSGRDRDGDGLIGKRDQCPDAPEDDDNFAQADGCPEFDNDKDGIPDTLDYCPAIPEDKDGYRDDDGCEDLDNDNDGVVDAKDRCPNDAGVDGTGCPVQEETQQVTVHNHVEAAEPVVVKSNPIVVRIDEQLTQRPDPEVVTNTDLKLFARVYFDTDQDEVKPSAQPVLTRLAGLLNDHPEITEMQIRGYADERGDAQYNLELSQRRAAAVKDFLVARGVAPQRLITVGLGEYSPAVPTGDAKGKDLKNRYEANRRVQFRILEQDGPEDGFSLN